MGTINRVVILGVIGHQPELRQSANGKPFVRLSISTYKRVKDDSGATRRNTQWHQVMFWGKNAELCSTYCEKGAPIYIEGHLAHYTQLEEGRKVQHTSIVVDQMQFIPGSKMAIASDRGEIEALNDRRGDTVGLHGASTHLN